jgi:hypothetical protein
MAAYCLSFSVSFWLPENFRQSLPGVRRSATTLLGFSASFWLPETFRHSLPGAGRSVARQPGFFASREQKPQGVNSPCGFFYNKMLHGVGTSSACR